jgi:hypothetical protein
MRHLLLAMLLPVALARGCQCGGDSAHTDTAPAPAPTSMSANSARLKAAMAISSISERDEALAKLAADASAQGDADVTAKAVEGVIDVTLHDKAAGDSALALAKAGKTSPATDVARTIRSQSQRDATLAHIAKGAGN